MAMAPNMSAAGAISMMGAPFVRTGSAPGFGRGPPRPQMPFRGASVPTPHMGMGGMGMSSPMGAPRPMGGFPGQPRPMGGFPGQPRPGGAAPPSGQANMASPAQWSQSSSDISNMFM